MSTIGRLAAALAAAFLLLAAPAGAAPRAVPPGHSGASQYTETLPTAGGETPTAEIHGGGAVGGSGGHGGSGSGQGGAAGGGTSSGSESGASAGGAPATPAAALGAKNAKRLEKLGAEGKAAARLAAAGEDPAKAAIGGARPASGAEGSSPVKQVVGELTGTSDSGGMGLVLPLLIVMTVLVAAAFVFARRRPVEPRD